MGLGDGFLGLNIDWHEEKTTFNRVFRLLLILFVNSFKQWNSTSLHRKYMKSGVKK